MPKAPQRDQALSKSCEALRFASNGEANRQPEMAQAPVFTPPGTPAVSKIYACEFL
jgi:hypothetical protein